MRSLILRRELLIADERLLNIALIAEALPGVRFSGERRGAVLSDAGQIREKRAGLIEQSHSEEGRSPVRRANEKRNSNSCQDGNGPCGVVVCADGCG